MRRFAAIAFFVTLACGCFAMHESSSPENVLDDIATAAADRDVSRFHVHVDEQQLAAKLDRYVSEKIASAPPGVQDPLKQVKIAPMALGGPAAADLMHFIETGRFERSAWLAYATQIVVQGDREIEGSPQKIDANTAQIRLRVTHPDLQQPFTMQLDVRRNGKNWQLVDVPNLGDFLRAADEARERRLAAANTPLQLAIDHAVELRCDDIRMRDTQRILQIEASNRSGSDIESLVVHTSATSYATLVADGFRKFVAPIAAGQTMTLPMRDRDFEFDRGFASAPPANLTTACEATEIDFADGRVLKLESTVDLLSPNVWRGD